MTPTPISTPPPLPHDVVTPARFPKEILRFRNQRHAETVDLGALTDDEWAAAFARFSPLPGNLPAPIALRYHGHQFGSYNPNLGDGRGFLFAQVRDAAGRRLDLGTKGSGTTPWSRGGDGRLTLKGGVRELLATEMLEALGVNTSKTFSLFETGESLTRHDEPSPTRASVLTRLSHSHIRFGTFQRLAHIGDGPTLRRVLDFAIAEYHPTTVGPASFLRAVCSAVAMTCGRWMAAGFAHGVLNTDNMNITGESFDYGPWRFVPVADPLFTAAYFDSAGLYAWGRQPEAVRWNLERLRDALAPLGESMDSALDGFGSAFFAGLRAGVLQRLGLTSAGDAADSALVGEWFGWLEATRVPIDQAYFDCYGGTEGEKRRARSPVGKTYRAAKFDVITALFSAYTPTHPDRLRSTYLQRERPIDAQIETVESLWEAIAQTDDWAPLTAHIADIRRLGALLSAQPCTG